MNFSFEIIIEAALAVLLLCSLIAVLYAARRSAIKPLPKPDGTELFTVVAASGGAEQLEQTVRGLLLLRDNGEIVSRVVIADCGLDEHPKKLAELLARESEPVTFCPPRDLAAVLEECGWTETKNT